MYVAPAHKKQNKRTQLGLVTSRTPHWQETRHWFWGLVSPSWKDLLHNSVLGLREIQGVEWSERLHLWWAWCLSFKIQHTQGLDWCCDVKKGEWSIGCRLTQFFAHVNTYEYRKVEKPVFYQIARFGISCVAFVRWQAAEEAPENCARSVPDPLRTTAPDFHSKLHSIYSTGVAQAPWVIRFIYRSILQGQPWAQTCEHIGAGNNNPPFQWPCQIEMTYYDVSMFVLL